MYLKFRDYWFAQDKPVPVQYKRSVAACDLLTRGLARIGIIALVDEATGYQYDRPRQDLAEILEQFISKQLCAWAKTFQDDYYKELFRLRGWSYRSFSTKRPILAGKLTVDIIYQRLAPAVLRELQRLNPANAKGRRKHKYFQWLTPDIGHPKLKEHLSAIIALMRSSDTWDDFKRRLDRALPKYRPMPLFESCEAEAEEIVVAVARSSSEVQLNNE